MTPEETLRLPIGRPRLLLVLDDVLKGVEGIGPAPDQSAPLVDECLHGIGHGLLSGMSYPSGKGDPGDLADGVGKFTCCHVTRRLDAGTCVLAVLVLPGRRQAVGIAEGAGQPYGVASHGGRAG
ncbi:hypothetical protein, partial [Streptomyces sp. NPDC056632]|uniref:hypothetical protein n=1 Tax=Streptomyces sp. NPDC056632 TaxID=3345884 RepID=UPI0036828AB1